jgi:PAS domain S-box-containing protein
MKIKIRILYIDDNVHDRKLINNALQKEHDEFELIEADSREKFNICLTEGGFDIVLSDFNIMGLDGLQVIKLVKEKDPDLPVIIVTGKGSEEIAIQAMEMGAADYVIKSAKYLQGLVSVIHKVYEHKTVLEEHKRTEETLRHSEIRYRRLHEGLIDGFAFTDMDGIIIECNETFQQMLGYSFEELSQLTYLDITPEKWHNFEIEIIKGQVLQNGYSSVYQKEYYKKDGTIFPVELRVYLFKNETGENEGMCAIVRDITARKMAEHTLQQSEEKYRLLYENMVTGVFYQSADGTLTDINPAGLKMFGLTMDQFMGRTSYDPDWNVIDEKLNILKPEQFPSIVALKTAKDVDRVVGVFNLLQQDYVWLSVFAKPQFKPQEDRPCQVFVTMHDITERKLMEDVLQKMSSELQMIFNNMINAFIVWDSVFDENGNYISFRFGQFNEAYARIAKLKYEDVQGKDVFEVWPDSEQSWVDVFGRVALTGKPDTFDMYHGPTKGWYHCNAYRPADSPAQICVFFEDITERKQAEEVIRESEERFRMVFENVFDGICLFDEDPDPSKRKLIECNARYAAMAGRTREELLRIGNTQELQITHEDTANKVRLKSLSENIEFRGSFSWIRPDEKENFIEYIGMPIVWRGKSLSIGIDRDVTLQKQTEEQIKKSEEKYRSIFENVQDVYYETSIDGKILEVSPSIEIISKGQYTREYLIGKSMYDFYPSNAERDKLLSLMQKQGNVRDFEMKLKNKDGSSVHCAVSAKILYDSQGNLRKIVGSMHDISERKKLEIEQFWLLDIIEKSLNEVYVFNSTTLKFEYLNKGASQNIGYTLDEIKNMTPLDIKPQYTIERFKEMIQPLINLEKEKIVFETILRRKNGTDYQVEVHLQLHSTEYKSLFFAVTIDITERKRIEKELYDLNTALEKRVIERTKELGLKNTELERMNRLFVGRELRMAELKQTIKKLEEKLIK